MICSICVDEISSNSIKTKCNHVYHKECWDQYAQYNYLLPSNLMIRCPNCKTILLDCTLLRQFVKAEKYLEAMELVEKSFDPKETNREVDLFLWLPSNHFKTQDFDRATRADRVGLGLVQRFIIDERQSEWRPGTLGFQTREEFQEAQVQFHEAALERQCRRVSQIINDHRQAGRPQTNLEHMDVPQGHSVSRCGKFLRIIRSFFNIHE